MGDSTERDAELYRDFYFGRNYPRGFDQVPFGERIDGVYIRDVESSAERDRAERALAEIMEAGGKAAFFSNGPELLEKTATLL